MSNTLVFVLCLLLGNPVLSAEKLVLDLAMETDLLSLSHNIDDFLFSATRNYSVFEKRNLNAAAEAEALRNHLAVTALVRIDGEIAGYATEQEVVSTDPQSGHPIAHSAWLILLNWPGLAGFLAVTQKEDASGVFALAARVLQEPDGSWENRWHRFLSTSGTTRVQLATGDLATYQGGVFEEYNYLNPADYGKLNRFRGRIQFIFYPADSPPKSIAENRSRDAGK